MQAADPDEEASWVWNEIKAETRRDAESEPALASYLYSTILSHSTLDRSLAFHLGNKLCSSTLLSTLLYDLFLNTFLLTLISGQPLLLTYAPPGRVTLLVFRLRIVCLIIKGFLLVRLIGWLINYGPNPANH